MDTIKILITGGHVTPAIAVIDEIEKRYPLWKIVFVGRKYAVEGSRTTSEEYRLITQRAVHFLSLFTGRLQRAFTLYTIVSLLKVPFGFLQALSIVMSQQPDAIISFGGYVALPVVFAGFLCGVRILTHEQTLAPGIANRIIAQFASKICISYEDVATYFSSSKLLYTGLPIRQSLFHKVEKSPFSFRFPRIPLLYVTGGSTGATSLNEIIYSIVKDLTRSFMIIHQVGRLSFEYGNTIRNSLPQSQQIRYQVLPYLDEKEHAWVLQHASILIGRSGANTVAELASLGVVSILIPLPWSAGQEQTKNAQYLARHGGALVLMQEEATPTHLARTIKHVMNAYNVYKKKALAYSKEIRRDGATRIVDTLVTIL